MRIKIKKIVALMFLMLFLFGSKGVSVFAEETKIVKVGFPTFSGFSNVAEDGTLSGYTYEYLNEIAKYTGWKYEFVTVKDENEALSLMLDKLEKGEVDIIGGILNTEQTAEMFDFPEYNCGMTYSTLSVLKDNKQINETNYGTFNGMRVGVKQKSKRIIKSLDAFCNANGIQVEKKEYETTDDMDKALENKEVDSLLGNDLVIGENQRIVARFDGKPYYFAVTKGNAEVVSGMNMAISKINEENPHYATELYMKYFDQGNQSVSLDRFVRANPMGSVIGAMAIGLVTAATVGMMFYIRNQRIKQILLDSERYRILSEISNEFIFEYDIQSDRLMLSNQYRFFKGGEPVIDHFMQKVKNGQLKYGDGTNHQIFEKLFINGKKQQVEPFDVQCVMVDGAKEWMHVTVTTVCDKKNQPLRFIGKMVSIEKEKQEKDALIQKAQKDPLTGLYNRVYFEERVKKYLEERPAGEEGAFMVIDLDCFKSVNDILGHQIGDEVLYDLGQLMKTVYGPEDYLGRLGGDEFMAFIKNTGKNETTADERAAELCAKMNKKYKRNKREVQISLSVGITFSCPGRTFEELYNEADNALYYMKRHGKKSFYTYNPNEKSEGDLK
ncbi:MAG: GGDEF domain-containing protein [Eubacterium sp.]